MQELVKGWERHRQTPCRGCRVDYQFDVSIPGNSNIEVAQSMTGKLTSLASGTISASNVNGPIYVNGPTIVTP
jgi:hypothetical protein